MKKRELFNSKVKAKGQAIEPRDGSQAHRVCHGSYMYACGEDRGIFQMNGEVIIIKT
ncbi:hypothetical protein NXW84_04145 [Bacteroides fragilis]|nr:hypothetical protein NXW84_04145 [Bacteroides fragilis]